MEIKNKILFTIYIYQVNKNYYGENKFTFPVETVRNCCNFTTQLNSKQ